MKVYEVGHEDDAGLLPSYITNKKAAAKIWNQILEDGDTPTYTIHDDLEALLQQKDQLIRDQDRALRRLIWLLNANDLMDLVPEEPFIAQLVKNMALP